MTQPRDDPIDLRSMAELGCWFMVALAPFLTWVNGPPVSTDQAVVRTTVFALALAGGVVLSVRRFARTARQASATPEEGAETASAEFVKLK